jgi:tight adherence protein C
VTAAIALVGALGLLLLVSGLPVVRRTRLRDRVEPYLSGLHGRPSALLSPATLRGGLVGWVGRGMERVLPTPHGVQERLEAAGVPAEAAGAFRLAQATWGVAGVGLAWSILVVATLAGVRVDVGAVAPLTALAFTSGWLARDRWLTRRIERARELVSEELPTAIDLLTLSIVSGESAPAAFARVARSMSGAIGSELARTVADMRAGMPTIDALEAMKKRVPIPGVERLVDALVTGIERGAPLADVLRAQAEDEREARRRHLLEMGGRREVLMLVPVVFLIMPVVVAFTLLPGLVALDLLIP